MTLDDLVDTLRVTINDTVSPYLWSVDDLELYINAAQQQATLRANLLFESSNATYCSIVLAPAVAVYQVHALVYEVRSVLLDNKLLTRTTKEHLNSEDEGWQTTTGTPTHYILTGQELQVYPTPVSVGVLNMTVYRLPITIVSLPDIPERYHLQMLDYAAFLAYSKRDSDTSSTSISAQYINRFTANFGEAQTANITRQHVYSIPVVRTTGWV